MRKVITFSFFLLFLVKIASAQNNVSRKYYDSSWVETSKDSSYYFTEYVKLDSTYKAISYRTSSERIKQITFYTDTSFQHEIGLSKKYYDNGQLEDSTLYDKDGDMSYSYYYYQNGNKWVHYTYNADDDKEITEAFDINGKLINDFIYFREAAFEGGDKEWQNYLAENIKSKVPIKKKAPNGQYQVIIRFIVGANGKIIDIEPETHLGYGMEEEVIRVIKKSPKWIPAIWLNKPVNAYRRQPLTFVVSEE